MATLMDTTDATVWAAEFIRIFAGHTIVQSIADNPNAIEPLIDEGTFLAWFANAIEIGRNEGRKEVCLHRRVHIVSEEMQLCVDCGFAMYGPPPVVGFSVAKVGECSHTYSMEDGDLVYGEFSFVTDLEFFEDRDEEVRLIRKRWQLVEEDILVMPDPYPIEEEDADDGE